MGLFTSEKVVAPVVEKSLADQLADVKSVFKKEYDDASKVVEQCVSHVEKQQVKIKELETEIRCTNSVKDDAATFMSKLKDLV